jgi:hypothetical protein
MNEDNTSDMFADLRGDLTCHRFALPWYLPMLANIARHSDDVAHKIHGLPGASWPAAFEELAPGFRRLQAAARDILNPHEDEDEGPPLTVQITLQELVDALDAVPNATALQDNRLPDIYPFLGKLEEQLCHVHSQFRDYCLTMLSDMDSTIFGEEISQLQLLEHVDFVEDDGNVSCKLYAAFIAGPGLFGVSALGHRRDDGGWDHELSYEIADPKRGWAAIPESEILMSPEQKLHILSEVRREVESEWLRHTEATRGVPDSSASGPEE